MRRLQKVCGKINFKSTFYFGTKFLKSIHKFFKIILDELFEENLHGFQIFCPETCSFIFHDLFEACLYIFRILSMLTAFWQYSPLGKDKRYCINHALQNNLRHN